MTLGLRNQPCGEEPYPPVHHPRRRASVCITNVCITNVCTSQARLEWILDGRNPLHVAGAAVLLSVRAHDLPELPEKAARATCAEALGLTDSKALATRIKELKELAF